MGQIVRTAAHEPGTRDEPVRESDWRGTARYEVRGRLGQGGMGIVYEAFDRERGQVVALKTLPRFDPAALYLFKHEFRTLADVHHANLVRLYELVVAEGDQVFFTMELVRGTNFREFVQSATSRVDSAPPATVVTMRPRVAAMAFRRVARHTSGGDGS